MTPPTARSAPTNWIGAKRSPRRNHERRMPNTGTGLMKAAVRPAPTRESATFHHRKARSVPARIRKRVPITIPRARVATAERRRMATAERYE